MNRLIFRQIAATAAVALMVWSAGCVRPRPKAQPDLGHIFRPARELTGKTPIIIIPGMLGSRLENKRTGEIVWPRAHPVEDALTLPTTPALKVNRDDVVATGLVETAKLGFPIGEIKVYEEFIDNLTKYAGYKRGDINNPSPDGYQDTFYLFPYDWRRDNVETVQLLADKITRLKQKLQRPDLRFNLITHSMGGLIARYYLMYGGTDVLDQTAAQVTWAGAANVNKLILIGVPNEGTMDALRALVEGYPVAEGGLGLFGKVEAATAFTMPAAFQLLPHTGSQEFYDGRLQPMAANLYEVETWQRHRWSIYAPAYRRALTKKMQKTFGPTWQREFDGFLFERELYLKVVLTRARRFSAALDSKADLANTLKVFILTGDCERTLRAALIIDDGDQSRTFFRARKLNLKGTDLTSAQVEAKLFEPGDGRVTRRSALAISHGDTVSDRSDQAHIAFAIFGCEIHSDLPNNPTIQDNLLSIFLR
ncbi:MAG: esterase/lipase family protein [Pyrinomonadaceae bacterium]